MNTLLRTTPLLILLAWLSFLVPQKGTAQDGLSDPAADLLKQGKNALSRGQYEDAIKDFNKADKLRHDSCAECRLDLAVAQSRIGNMNDALANCDKAISSASDDSLRIESHVLKANVLTSMGSDPKTLKLAESEYRAALQVGKQIAALHLDLGVVLLRESQDTEGFQELNTYLQLAPDGDGSEYARKLLSNPRRSEYAFAPDFQISTVQGETVSLRQVRGKIVVLDFWATWCPPCVSSVPELKELTKKYPSQKLTLISISADTNAGQWQEFIQKKNMEWPQYWDRDGQIRKAFNVHAFPTYLVIDQDGFIEQRIVGLDPRQSVVFRLRNALQVMLPAAGPG